MSVLDITSSVLIVLGCFFGITGAVGVIRMPDFYTRIHPAGKSDTMAQSLIMLGLMLQVSDWNTLVKLIMVMMVLMATSPVATYSITQAAYHDGLLPWKKNSSDSTDSEQTNDSQAGGAA